jgi:hypothetical protein
MMIDAELVGRITVRSSQLRWERLKSLDARTDPPKQIKLIVKVKKSKKNNLTLHFFYTLLSTSLYLFVIYKK